MSKITPMRHVTRFFFSTALTILVVSSAHATELFPPDFGLKGLREVEVDIDETIDHEIQLYSIDSSNPCGDLTGLFAKAGLPIKSSNSPRNPDAGVLFLSINRESENKGTGSVYYVSLRLSQDVRLIRDPTRKLGVPSTYENERFGFVSKDSAHEKTCSELKTMLSDFLSLWRGWNDKQ